MSDRRSRYLHLAELVRRHRTDPFAGTPTRDLTPYELSLFSQNGEDGVLAEIFRRIGVTNREFVEFGIECGHEGNTVALAQVLGWQGLYIEGSDEFYPVLERRYRRTPGIRTALAMVTPENIEDIILGADIHTEPDLISIDVDSIDYWIWKALERIRPRVVVIEYNAHLDPEIRVSVPSDHRGWDGTDAFGASLGAMRALGETKGYRLIHTELSGVNAFFVRNDAAGAFDDIESVPLRAPNYYLEGAWHPPARNPVDWTEV